VADWANLEAVHMCGIEKHIVHRDFGESYSGKSGINLFPPTPKPVTKIQTPKNNAHFQKISSPRAWQYITQQTIATTSKKV